MTATVDSTSLERKTSTPSTTKSLEKTSTVENPSVDEKRSTSDQAPTVVHGHVDPHIPLEDAEAGAVEDVDHEKAFDGSWDADPGNPRNWPSGRKWAMVAVVAAYTFVSPLASSMVAPALPDIAEHFNITNQSLIALVLSIYLLAYAIGPLFLGPLSEIYGRRWVLHISNFVFIIFNIACAVAPNSAALTVFRLFAGLGGSAPLTIGAGTVTDLFREENRAGAMAIYSMGPLIGPIAGPIAGGFIVESLNFHWIFWILAMVGAAASMFGIPLLKETYHPWILANREMQAYHAKQTQGLECTPPHRPSLKVVMWENLTRPALLLTRSFVCFILSLYMAIIYGVLYLMFVTYPEVYANVYGWNSGFQGLAYIGVGVGFLIGTGLGGHVVDMIYIRLRDANGGVGKPEFRIPVMFFGSIFLPIGLLWYGWTADKHKFWLLPIIGSGFFGVGMMTCFLCIQVYLVDTFRYAASAIAAATVLRSLFGFAFPLFANRIFDSLGIGPGYSLLAGICCLVGIPFPIWIYFKGEAMREKSDLSR